MQILDIIITGLFISFMLFFAFILPKIFKKNSLQNPDIINYEIKLPFDKFNNKKYNNSNNFEIFFEYLNHEIIECRISFSKDKNELRTENITILSKGIILGTYSILLSNINNNNNITLILININNKKIKLDNINKINNNEYNFKYKSNNYKITIKKNNNNNDDKIVLKLIK